MKKEIKIVGAGLSGLTAGINLLGAGYDVTIYEQRKDIGLRFHNDFQGMENWTQEKDVLELLKEMNIKINFFFEPVFEGFACGPHLARIVKFSSQKPICYLVKRGNSSDSIDFGLKQQFTSNGGRIIFEHRISFDEADIIATGPKKVRAIALGYMFNTDLKDIAAFIIDENIAPKLYAYLIIKNGRGVVAVTLSKNFKKQEYYLKSVIDAFRKGFNLRMINKRKFGGSVDFAFPPRTTKSSKLLVGEAAGFQDAFAGFGMFYAMRSGFLAAKSIINNKDYNKLWKKDFGDLLKAGLVNRFIFERMGNKGYDFLINSIESHSEDITSLIKREYSFSRKKKLLFPLACAYFKMAHRI